MTDVRHTGKLITSVQNVHTHNGIKNKIKITIGVNFYKAARLEPTHFSNS